MPKIKELIDAVEESGMERAIQIRTGCIDKDGNFEADGKDVAYYHVDCFNRVTGQRISPAKKG